MFARLDAKAFRCAALLFIVNKLFVMIPAAAATRHLLSSHSTLGYVKYLLVDNFYRWDSGWYGIISQNGYTPKASAFFPMFPILISLVKGVLGTTPQIAAVLISNAAFFILLYFAYRLIRLDYDDTDTRKVLWLLAVFPTSYYFSAAYTESLFCLLMVLSLYSMRRSQWALAGIYGFFSSVTRNTGVFLTLPYALEYFRIQSWADVPRFFSTGYRTLKERGWRNFFWVFAIPVPLFLYMAYLQVKFHDALAFSHSQVQFGRSFLNPVLTIIYGYQMIISFLFKHPFDWYWIYYGVQLFIVSITLVLLITSLRHLRLSYWIILFYAFVIPIAAPAKGPVIDYFVSYIRYSLVIFPLYPAIYELVKRWRYAYWLTILVFVILLLTLDYAWSSGSWVA